MQTSFFLDVLSESARREILSHFTRAELTQITEKNYGDKAQLLGQIATSDQLCNQIEITVDRPTF